MLSKIDFIGVKMVKIHYPRLKRFLSEMDDGVVPVDLWRYQDTGTTDKASKDLENLIGRGLFDFPKPTNLIKK